MAYRRGGVWYADAQYKGGRVRMSCGKDATRADARALEGALLQRLKDRDSGVYYLDDALERWRLEYLPRLKQPEVYEYHLRALEPFLIGRLITDAPDIAREYIQKRKRAPVTVNQGLRILRRLCNLAFEWGWVHVQIGQRIKCLPETKRGTYLTMAQVEAILPHCTEGVRDAVLLACYTGLRLSEIERAAPSHVDGSLLTVAVTKSGKSRVVPLPRVAQAIPLPIRATRNQIQQGFRSAARKAGLGGVRFHDLRHTYASWLLQRGASLSVIQELLGHSTIAITRDLYAHLSRDQLEAAVKLLDTNESQ